MAACGTQNRRMVGFQDSSYAYDSPPTSDPWPEIEAYLYCGAAAKVEKIMEAPQVQYDKHIVEVPKVVTQVIDKTLEAQQGEYIDQISHVPKVVTQRRRAQGCRRRSSSRKSSTRRGW